MKAFKALLCLALVLGVTLGASDVINKDIILKKYERKIDLTSQLVKSVHKITIENTGSSPVKYFLFVLTAQEHEKLSFIGAQVGLICLWPQPCRLS